MVRTYENGKILKAVPGPAISHQRLLIPQNEGNLNDSGHASRHKSVTKHRMGGGADMQLLGVRGHGPASNENHKARNEVTLRVAIAIAAKPDAGKSRAPPDDSHGRVLPVVPDPVGAPAVFSECVDASPSSDHRAVVKLLGTTSSSEPDLSNQQDDSEQDAVSHECTAHNEVSGALTDMIALAETKRSDAAKDQLCPGKKRHSLADDRMTRTDQLSDLAVDALLPVSLKIESQYNLPSKKELQDPSEASVNIVANEFATPMGVAEEETDDCEKCSE